MGSAGSKAVLGGGELPVPRGEVGNRTRGLCQPSPGTPQGPATGSRPVGPGEAEEGPAAWVDTWGGQGGGRHWHWEGAGTIHLDPLRTFPQQSELFFLQHCTRAGPSAKHLEDDGSPRLSRGASIAM